MNEDWKKRLVALRRFLTGAPFIGGVMLLLVLVSGILVLTIPNSRSFPKMNVASEAQRDCYAEFSFDYSFEDIDQTELNKRREAVRRSFPANIYVVDEERRNAILDRFRLFTELALNPAARPDDEQSSGGQAVANTILQTMRTLLFEKHADALRLELRGKKTAFLRKVGETLDDGVLTNSELAEGSSYMILESAPQGGVPRQRRSGVKIEDLSVLTAATTLSGYLCQRANSPLAELRAPLEALFETFLMEGDLKSLDRETYEARLQARLAPYELERLRACLTGAAAPTPTEAELVRELKTRRSQQIEKGEQIIAKGKTLTSMDVALYEHYRKVYREHEESMSSFPNLSFKILLSMLLIVFSWIYIWHVYREILSDTRALLLMGGITILALLLNRVFANAFHVLTEQQGFPPGMMFMALPLAFPAIVTSVIYGVRAAMFAGLFVSGIAAVALDQSFSTLVIGVFASGICSYAVRDAYDYKKFYIYAFLSGAAILILGATLFQENPDIVSMFRARDYFGILFLVGIPIMNAGLTAALALVVIFFAESLFDVSTNMSYLAMTNRNHPLLKRLQMEAPGTYHHCERVASLAEKACMLIGANPLKAQACALFHDIGKLENPAMFTENATGFNPHDKLTPLESATVIKSHVTSGLKYGRRYQLKTPLLTAIQRHHGTDFISFFFEKERQLTGKTPDENDFRYPGPLPEDPETVILMMADCCEAATSSLSDPSPENIRSMVTGLFDKKLKNGQFAKAKMTCAELHAVRECIIETLVAMSHVRIAYPKFDDGEKK